MVQIFIIVPIAIVLFIIFLWAFILHIDSVPLAERFLVKKSLNSRHDPVEMVSDACRTHLFSQVSDALEHLLDYFFVGVDLNSVLEVRDEHHVKELFDFSVKRLLGGQAWNPLQLVVAVFLSEVQTAQAEGDLC